MTLVELAESIARKAHSGQFRRGGVTPYIIHPERVVARLRAQGPIDDRILAVAWLHDVLEDTEVTVSELKNAGIPLPVLDSIAAITRWDGQPYEDYLFSINQDPYARVVKIADILDNLSDAPTEKQIIKYAKALLHLTT